jgi:uncharacterized membrane protein (UPF0127 family)
MRFVDIYNSTHPLNLPIRAGYADTFLFRLRGLMFRPLLSETEGLLLVERSESRLNAAIHMLFMNFDLAVVWLNTQNEVVDVQFAKRWAPSYTPARPARYTLEIHPSRLKDFQIGDKVLFETL